MDRPMCEHCGHPRDIHWYSGGKHSRPVCVYGYETGVDGASICYCQSIAPHEGAKEPISQVKRRAIVYFFGVNSFKVTMPEGMSWNLSWR